MHREEIDPPSCKGYKPHNSQDTFFAIYLEHGQEVNDYSRLIFFISSYPFFSFQLNLWHK